MKRYHSSYFMVVTEIFIKKSPQRLISLNNKNIQYVLNGGEEVIDICRI